METKKLRQRKSRWVSIAMLVLSLVGLMMLTAVVVAEWLTNNSSLLNAIPRPPRPADKPVLVVEAMDSEADLPPLLPLPDLTKVDRRLIEPAGLLKPRYCLLVFGPQAKSHVWIIEDGETIYVDRNGNGDLREAGEAVTPSERPDKNQLGGPYEWTYLLGDLTPSGQSEKHTGLKLVRYQGGINSVLSVWVGGIILQYAGWGPLFTESRETAPIVHFGGPVLAKPLRSSALRVNEARQEIHFCLGTPGLGKHSFAYVGYEAVPAEIHPVVEVAWPSGGAVFKERFALTRRC